MSEAPAYGAFEHNPARYTETEAWVCFDGEWRQFNAGEVHHNARWISETEYNKEFPKAPPLPKEAFKSAS